MKKVSIFDSTLRDGAQETGISFSLEDKLSVIRLLDRIGVDYIEAGNPYSNPKDMELYKRAAGLRLQHAKLVAFGSTRRKNCLVEEDANLLALVGAGTEICVIFGKSSVFHVENVIETTLDENLRMIEESCRFLTKKGKRVFFDAEHFFDGYKENRDYAMKTLAAAEKGGAELLCLCDTNGGSFPGDAREIVKHVCERKALPIGVHFHNDCAMADANSLMGLMGGAVQVQGTFLGIGERCGNANLCSLIASLQIKLGLECIPQENIRLLAAFAKEMASLYNGKVPTNMPYVGDNAFSHKAGMHAAAVLKTSRSFEHIDPFLVGNRRKFPTSEISGRAVIMERVREILPGIKEAEAEDILAEIKRLELDGYQFEGADASFELLVRRMHGEFRPFFELINYKIYTGIDDTEGCSASATVKVRVGNTVQLMAAEGNGPVNALDTALRKALEIFYPLLSQVKLTDYKVRVLDSKDATAAVVRVLITSFDGKNTFTTVGVSGDVVGASWRALEDSMEYILSKK